MTNVVRGAGRARHKANERHQQRTPLPPKSITDLMPTTPRAKARAIVKEEAEKIVSEAKAAKSERISKAQELALAAEEAGWDVERIVNGSRKTLIARRGGNEVLEASWENNRACAPMGYYSINGNKQKLQHVTVAKKIMATPSEVASRNAENMSANRKAPKAVTHASLAVGVPFDPATASDEEVMAALLGREITWRNVLSGGELTGLAVVPEQGKQTKLEDDDLKDRATRQLTFCDAEGGGYYTLRLSQLLSVGAKKDEGGRMLMDARHRALISLKEGSKK